MEKINLRPDIDERINNLINVFGVSASAIGNFLIDKGLKIIEERLPEIAKQFEENSEFKKAFTDSLKIHYQRKRG